ncbi:MULTISPECIES: nucleotide sugar dehydrogenase [Kitasatospora]|uniref:Putative UDP-glucose dehydrogenase n=1 Tax=Kitasatospora setae (strain ATCC 33774 / DSM 43861 / JCM 3304 / KCC A-0304 / NBRC 14216 / KM-6054) TaxID=452652 RepID=E4N7C4_KITSK|nr:MULTISPECIES: nucleotide sugar dehydrogenase [Kitasatospora]BAJ27105.1 putative UDP-glucose dehydrogenase [Kitasatospora setae KM-6054]
MSTVALSRPSLPSRPTSTGTVAVVGLGYVGLPTALALLGAGRTVIGLDVSPARLEAIRRQDVDLLPSDLDRLAAAVDDPRFALTDDPALLADASVVIVCVPTPVDAHLVPDLDALAAACATAVAHAVPGQLLMLTSTTYVGCTRDLVLRPLLARGLTPGEDVHVAFSPERIDPGNAHHAQDRTPRVVGGATPRCTELAAEALLLTAPSVHRVSSPEAAEMSKLYENTFRAVNIALANEFADNCRGLGLDPLEVIEAAATKPYGFMPFYPGPGVGGHCIPCDPHYLLWQLRGLRIASPLIDTAMTAIAGRPRQVVQRVRELLGDRGRPLTGARVLLVGVSYKPGVADLRESPALEILEELGELGASAAFHDPLVPSARLHGAVLHSVADPAAEEWDLIVVHTVQPGSDLAWLAGREPVLDATYRLSGVPAKAVL